MIIASFMYVNKERTMNLPEKKQDDVIKEIKHEPDPPEKPKELMWWEKIIEFIVELLKAIGILETKSNFDFVIS